MDAISVIYAKSINLASIYLKHHWNIHSTVQMIQLNWAFSNHSNESFIKPLVPLYLSFLVKCVHLYISEHIIICWKLVIRIYLMQVNWSSFKYYYFRTCLVFKKVKIKFFTCVVMACLSFKIPSTNPWLSFSKGCHRWKAKCW